MKHEQAHVYCCMMIRGIRGGIVSRRCTGGRLGCVSSSGGRGSSGKEGRNIVESWGVMQGEWIPEYTIALATGAGGHGL